MQRERAQAMTIGQLSRRTAVSIKTLRDYERLGFLYTLGRSAGNYRLFGDEALWCVQVIGGLRSLGLTLKEIKLITSQYTAHPEEPIEELVGKQISQALARVEARIAHLQTLRQRILDFGAAGMGTGTLLPSPSPAMPHWFFMVRLCCSLRCAAMRAARCWLSLTGCSVVTIRLAVCCLVRSINWKSARGDNRESASLSVTQAAGDCEIDSAVCPTLYCSP